MMDASAISRTGLDVEWRRLEIIAQNLANVNTTRTASGQPFSALRLVSGPKPSFHGLLEGPGSGADLAGVAVLSVESGTAAPRRVYQPGHPDADAAGYVNYPAIDQVGEMTAMVKTARAYEADIVAMKSAGQMYAKALEIGKRS